MSCILRLHRDKCLLAEVEAAGLEGSVPRNCIGKDSVNVTVSDADFADVKGQIQETLAFLKAHGTALKKLEAKGSFDFGIAARDVAVQTDHFPPDLLRAIADVGFGLDVSIYPIDIEGAI